MQGNSRRSAGELAKREGGGVFEIRTPVCITILVKNPNAQQNGQIYFRKIEDYLSRKEKLEKISELVSINGISKINGWEKVQPDAYNDWINQRDDSFNQFIILGNKKDKSVKTLFDIYSGGIKTNRDAWCYNSSKSRIQNNIKNTLKVYAEQRALILQGNEKVVYDPTLISWSGGLENKLRAGTKITFDSNKVCKSTYRPYSKQWLYYDRDLNERRYQMPQIFPTANVENLIFSVTGLGGKKGFSTLISNVLLDLNSMDAGAQCFPLYLYEEVTQDKSVGSGDLFDNSLDLTISETKYQRKDGISDVGLAHFQTAYPKESISKEDIFYYVYGLLHSEDYRERYADNLTKELPRIPCVKKAEDFWAFSKAGRDLANWHLNYETVDKYPATLDTGSTPYSQLSDEDFRVEKMKFAKKDDKSTVIYNKRITVKGIPLEAYDYVVNGKPALEWVMERQGVSTHKESGIVNDANDWANETMGNAAYPLELFLRVITVSLETMKIVKSLPKLDI